MGGEPSGVIPAKSRILTVTLRGPTAVFSSLSCQDGRLQIYRPTKYSESITVGLELSLIQAIAVSFLCEPIRTSSRFPILGAIRALQPRAELKRAKGSLDEEASQETLEKLKLRQSRRVGSTSISRFWDAHARSWQQTTLVRCLKCWRRP